MLLSREAIGEAVERIDAEYFYAPAHHTVYTEIVDLWQKGEAVNLISFTQHLRDRNLLETVGGAAAVTSLYTIVPFSSEIGDFIDIVTEKYILRSIIANGTEQVRRAYEEQADVEGLLADVERKSLMIRPNRSRAREMSIKDATMEAIEAIEAQYERKGVPTGLSTGFIEFDRMTNGLQPTDMIVIAARPSMGKTALAMNIAEHVAVTEKKPVGVFSLEMSRQQLVQRLLCSRARINLQKVRDGFLADRDFPALQAAASKVAESKLHIDDEMILADVLFARARRWKLDYDIVLLIVDYLQLLRAKGFKPNERRHEVEFVGSMLKRLAKELRIPIIVIAQLNRQPEQRSGGKPRLSDLRESGSIEQDADVVALLTRPEVYEEDEEARAEKSGEAELIIAKQRNGPIGEIPLTFLKEFTRFEDRARSYEQDES